MQFNGIDATLNQLVNQLPKGMGKTNSPETFQSLIETLRTQIHAAIEEAVTAGKGATVSSPAVPAAPTAAAPVTSTGRTTAQLTAYQQSLLKNPGGQMFEQLSGEAPTPLYNEREGLMRDELNLTGIEQRLKSKAQELDVEYHKSDLEGVLRNAGYDAAHHGATERYMAAVQKFIGEAENNYRQRSTNEPNRA